VTALTARAWERWLRRPSPGTPAIRRQVLDTWRRTSVEFRDGIAGDTPIEPYVLSTRLRGGDLDMLIPTVGAQSWYDNLAFFVDLDLIDRFRMIDRGGTVFDVGAHMGLYSLVFRHLVGARGRVVAFEPFHLNTEVLRLNARLNGVRIDVEEVAVTRRAGIGSASTVTECIADQDEHAVPIRLATLDDYAHLRPGFVKVDIEGAEIDALASAERLLALRPNLYIELHPQLYDRFGLHVDDLFDAIPFDDYVCYLQYPTKGTIAYRREFEITEPCGMFLMRDEPLRRLTG
jgi:FkbM family methyltransferase